MMRKRRFESTGVSVLSIQERLAKNTMRFLEQEMLEIIKSDGKEYGASEAMKFNEDTFLQNSTGEIDDFLMAATGYANTVFDDQLTRRKEEVDGVGYRHTNLVRESNGFPIFAVIYLCIRTGKLEDALILSK
jgi:hypothetical protein